MELLCLCLIGITLNGQDHWNQHQKTNMIKILKQFLRRLGVMLLGALSFVVCLYWISLVGEVIGLASILICLGILVYITLL
jgi:hypothetical protein